MKEELLRVLKVKLDDINNDISSLVELNQKIEDEENKLAYSTKILDIFKDNEDYNIMNFAKLAKNDFDNVLKVIDNDAEKIFSTTSCNYDGLVYLINGINSGVSLSLTEEQKSGIEYLIRGLKDKENEYRSAIDGFMLTKTRYPISDVAELNTKKESYEEVLKKIDNSKYVVETDILLEAIEFNELKEEEIINLLKYVLEYNADVYEKNKNVVIETKEVIKEEPITPPIVEEKEEFHFQEVPQNDIVEMPKDEPVIVNENVSVEDHAHQEEVSVPVSPIVEEYDTSSNEVTKDVTVNTIPVEIPTPTVDTYTPSVELPMMEEKPEEIIPPVVEAPKIDNDFKDVISESTDYEEEKSVHEEKEEKTSTRELQRLFNKYNIKEQNINLNELVIGSAENYREILDTLKSNSLIEQFENNSQLLIETLLYSTSKDIKNVLQLIKSDLSVDDDDYRITTRIAIDTIPSIFVNENGNYENFVKNIETFKSIGLNLINLFDFSKEIFVADNNNILRNLDIVRKYGFEINYKNAKYLLLISNIGEKIDYYVESVYEDKLRKETFDGIEYINNYAAKLNVVTDETIKRLRYASENGKKVFGTKPKSLSGEITNLKVNVLDMGSDYLNKFFNNEFENITKDEVREYVKLVHNSSNVGNYKDELQFLELFHKGLRYIIENINISYNKVLRNYNILRSYGIDSRKALQFAVCYNLVITKDEYQRLKNKLDEMGGNL